MPCPLRQCPQLEADTTAANTAHTSSKGLITIGLPPSCQRHTLHPEAQTPRGLTAAVVKHFYHAVECFGVVFVEGTGVGTTNLGRL